MDPTEGWIVRILPAMTRVFSGIQPTGQKHLGNYIGAIRHWPAYQDLGEAIYCVVDLHSISIPYDASTLRENTLEPTFRRHKARVAYVEFCEQYLRPRLVGIA